MNNILGRQFKYDNKVWTVKEPTDDGVTVQTFKCVHNNEEMTVGEITLMSLVIKFDEEQKKFVFRESPALASKCCMTCRYNGGWQLHTVKVKCELKEEQIFTWMKCNLYEKSDKWTEKFYDDQDQLFD